MKSSSFTMESYSFIKTNETVPFSMTWDDLEIAILSEVNLTERHTSCDFAYMCNLKRVVYVSQFTK